MAMAAFGRSMAKKYHRERLDLKWYGLGALAVVSLARGVQLFGPNTPGNDFRGMFYLLAAIVYFSTHRYEFRWVRDLVDIWIAVALLLAVAGLARMAGVSFGAAPAQETLAGGRALFAGPTLLIGQAALMTFFAKQLGSRWAGQWWLPYLLVFGVLSFRHRSVWLMMAISLAAMWTVLRPEQRRPADSLPLGRLLAAVLIGVGLTILAVGGGQVSGFRSDLTRSTETASGAGSTSMWRLEGWKFLLKQQSASKEDLVFGIPYGSGYLRKVGSASVNVSPHSWYIQTVNRVGLIGFMVLLGALWRLFRNARPVGLFPANLGALLLLSAVVYGIAYQPPESQGILLGVIALAARAAQGRSVAARGVSSCTRPMPVSTP